MVFGAFEDAKAASQALDRLEGQSFKTAGFSVIAREDARDKLSDRASQGMLANLVAEMSAAPNLSADGPQLAGAGALADLIEPEAPMALPESLQKLGLTRATSEVFAETVEHRGLIVAAAAEDPRRATLAEQLMTKEQAVETTTLDIPDAEARP